MNRLLAPFGILIIYSLLLGIKKGGRGWWRVDASVTRMCHSLFALVAVPKEGVLLALSCQAFARLLLADLELVLWSRRVVALWQVCVRSPPTCLSPLMWPSTAIRFFVYYYNLSGEYRCLVQVLLNDVQDIYYDDEWWFSLPLFQSSTQGLCIYHYHYMSHTVTKMLLLLSSH